MIQTKAYLLQIISQNNTESNKSIIKNTISSKLQLRGSSNLSYTFFALSTTSPILFSQRATIIHPNIVIDALLYL